MQTTTTTIAALLLSGMLHAQSNCDSTFFALFSFSTDGNTAQFQATSGGQANGYLWDLGDGTTEAGDAPAHTFPDGGPYEVCLSAWYWNGQDTCWTEYCEWISLGDDNPCDSLDASFFFNNIGSTVVFQANSFNEQWSYHWDLGDGSTGFGSTYTHTDPGPTLFQACLTVAAWDPITQDSCFATSCELIDLTGGGSACDSTFAVTFDWQATGPTVVFAATANLPVDGFIWDFGDGNMGWTQVVTHIYEPPGPYEVCVDAWYWNGTDSCWTSSCEEVDPFFMSAEEHAYDEQQWSAWPNPASGQLFVQAAGMSPAASTLRLFAADGRLFREERSVGWPHAMDVQGLAPGLYLLRLDGLQGGATHRVVVD